MYTKQVNKQVADFSLILSFCTHHGSMEEVTVVATNTGFPRRCGPTLIGSESREAFEHRAGVRKCYGQATSCRRLPQTATVVPLPASATGRISVQLLRGGAGRDG